MDLGGIVGELIVLGDHEHALAALRVAHARPARTARDLLVQVRTQPHHVPLRGVVEPRRAPNDDTGRGQVDSGGEGRGAHDHVDQVVLVALLHDPFVVVRERAYGVVVPTVVRNSESK